MSIPDEPFTTFIPKLISYVKIERIPVVHEVCDDV